MSSRKSKTVGDVIREQSIADLLWTVATVDDPVWLRRICSELGRRRAVDATSEILRVLQRAKTSGQWRLLEAAVDALGRIGDASAGGPIVDVLRDSTIPAGARDSAAFALAQLGYRPAIDVLIASLSDPIKTVRICAAAALARFGDGAARSRIELLLPAEPDFEVRAALSRAIQAILGRTTNLPKRAWMEQIRDRASGEEGTIAQHIALKVSRARLTLPTRIVASAHGGSRALNRPTALPSSWRQAMAANPRLRALQPLETSAQRFRVAF